MLFACLSSRAVHIEGVHSMDADSFILALRRLIARRGNIRLMRSDNAMAPISSVQIENYEMLFVKWMNQK